MTIFSHILATYFLGEILGLTTKREWFLAFLFGVGIDFLDFSHVVSGIKGLFLGETWFGRAGNHYYRSFIQEPVSLLWVVPLCFFLKSPIPAIFFILQAGMDFICKFEKRPFWPFSNFSTRWGLFPSGTVLEWVLSMGLLLVLLYIKRKKMVFYW